jgi:hypothetical protein
VKKKKNGKQKCHPPDNLSDGGEMLTGLAGIDSSTRQCQIDTMDPLSQESIVQITMHSIKIDLSDVL